MGEPDEKVYQVAQAARGVGGWQGGLVALQGGSKLKQLGVS